jgi:hypothetical protein
MKFIKAKSPGEIMPLRNDFPFSHQVADAAKEYCLEDGFLVRQGRKLIRTAQQW